MLAFRSKAVDALEIAALCVMVWFVFDKILDLATADYYSIFLASFSSAFAAIDRERA